MNSCGLQESSSSSAESTTHTVLAAHNVCFAPVQLVAYLMQLAGVGVVIAVMPQYWEIYSRQVMIHISVGIALEILAGGQVSTPMILT